LNVLNDLNPFNVCLRRNIEFILSGSVASA